MLHLHLKPMFVENIPDVIRVRTGPTGCGRGYTWPKR